MNVGSANVIASDFGEISSHFLLPHSLNGVRKKSFYFFPSEQRTFDSAKHC